MHRHFIKTPRIVRWFFSDYVWRVPVKDRSVFLTFDDGPHPEITPWVLRLLKEYDAKATFFCIGNNVEQFPEVYRQIREEGHAVGNHTYHHPNGWQTDTDTYLEDIRRAAELIDSPLFRPPYGRIKGEQAKRIKEAMPAANPKVIMWDVLSADFDTEFTPQQCLNHVVRHVEPGSVIVFHDSEKAYTNMSGILPSVLEELKEKNYVCRALEVGIL